MSPAEADAITKALGNSQGLIVVNLGAHQGQEHSFFKSLVMPGSRLFHIMAEADPRHCEFIRGNILSGDGNTLLVQAAISSESGVKKFRSADDGSGSLLTPSGDREARLHFSKPFDVTCISLDELFSHFQLPHIDLLWVDIQGSEKDMIAGGQKALSLTRYCFMEVENVPLYEGEALKPDLLALMKGWEVAGEFEYNVLLKNASLA